jgi:hypothetical protein
MKYVLALLFIASPAFASGTYHEEDGNAITQCRGAFVGPYEDGLRSRPLAIVNEGDAATFINCGWRAPTNSYGQEWVAIVLTNVNGPGRYVQCQGVFGKEDTGANYIARGVYVPAGGHGTVKWHYQQDNGGARWATNASAQCLLPPGMGIARTPQGYRQRP